MFLNCLKCKQNLDICVYLGSEEGALSLSSDSQKGPGSLHLNSAKEMRGLSNSCFFEVVSCVWELKTDLKRVPCLFSTT